MVQLLGSETGVWAVISGWEMWGLLHFH